MPQDSTQFVEAKRTVPAAAMCFNVGKVEFAAAADPSTSKNVPVTLLGRTGKPIQHWYWGRYPGDVNDAENPVFSGQNLQLLA